MPWRLLPPDGLRSDNTLRWLHLKDILNFNILNAAYTEFTDAIA